MERQRTLSDATALASGFYLDDPPGLVASGASAPHAGGPGGIYPVDHSNHGVSSSSSHNAMQLPLHSPQPQPRSFHPIVPATLSAEDSQRDAGGIAQPAMSSSELMRVVG